MSTILTLSTYSLSKLSETPKSGVFMVSNHDLDVVAARATLGATGVKTLPKGSMISIGDDELPKVREWLHGLMEEGRDVEMPQELAKEFLGVTKKIDRSRPRKGMSRSENRAGIADAIKAKELAENPPVLPPVGISTIKPVELKPVEKAAEKPAKAKKPAKAAKVEPVEEKPAEVEPVEEKPAEKAAEAVPAEYASHKRAYANGRDTKTGARHDRGVWNEWARGVIAAIDGQELPADASKHFKTGYAEGSKPLSPANVAWIAGYRSA